MDEAGVTRENNLDATVRGGELGAGAEFCKGPPSTVRAPAGVSKPSLPLFIGLRSRPWVPASDRVSVAVYSFPGQFRSCHSQAVGIRQVLGRLYMLRPLSNETRRRQCTCSGSRAIDNDNDIDDACNGAQNCD